MKKLEKILRNKGFILPVTLFLVFVLIWIFSIVLLSYKNEISNFYVLKNSNEDYWFMENLSTIAEYEVFKGEKQIKNSNYKDIIEYFEGTELVWIDIYKVSESGYRRDEVKHNGTFIKEDQVKLTPFIKNILEIKLIKDIEIETQRIEIKIFLFYEYLVGETNLFKSYKREIRKIEVNLKK
ncbi:hypothetical protein NON08_05190 [Cetobacterium somerae]|uniref:hypothetical protein n=1 Tax=Cetobacterium sp. NK01 TaxID=2993530 RepID=UPI00211648C9|nr:hypothetical protein [Cetobacterium sp. NK01]MCQ8211922.1 hypothetical protein [Cetobacterium sp. NK01]